MSKWHLVQQQPLPREIFKEPPIISYRKGIHSHTCERENYNEGVKTGDIMKSCKHL